MTDTIKLSRARCAKAGHFVTEPIHGRHYCNLCKAWVERTIVSTDGDGPARWRVPIPINRDDFEDSA